MTYVAKVRVDGGSLDDLLQDADRLATQFAGDRARVIGWPETIESGHVPDPSARAAPKVAFYAHITITVEQNDEG